MHTRKRWLPVCDEKRHTVHTGNSRRLRVTDATARELAAWMELFSPTNLAVVVEDFCGSQLVASDGIQRPRNLTGRWQEGLRVTTEKQNAELRPEI